MTRPAGLVGYGIGAAFLGMAMMVAGAQAQSLQRGTEQPLGAAGVTPRENGPAAPVTSGSGTTNPATPNASNPAPQRFGSEVEAKTACGTQPVVWVNTRSKMFFTTGTGQYGKGANGTFMCRDTAMSGGFKSGKS